MMAFQETKWVTKTPLDKLPSEKITRRADFSGWLNTGVTISSCVCTIEDKDGEDVTSAMLVESTTNDSTVDFVVQAGSEGNTYILKFALVLSNLDINEGRLKIRVQ